LAAVLAEEGVEARIFCYFETERMNDGVDFSASLIKRLGALDLALAVDIYNSKLWPSGES
jgi:hypothetical protein